METTNFNHVSVETRSWKLNEPNHIVDYSKPIIEKVIEEVEIVKEGMTVISERFNPFGKKTVYKVERVMIVGYTRVASYFDYRVAVQVAKRYAKENNLVFE